MTCSLVSESILNHLRHTREAESRSLESVMYGMTCSMTSSTESERGGVAVIICFGVSLHFLMSGSSMV